MSSIRVTYSGLISLFVSLSSSITGIIFVIIVTRQLDPVDFGLWTFIGNLVSYVLVVHPLISYWSMRQISRGIEVGKTAIFSSGILSTIAFSIYLIIAFYFSDLTESSIQFYLLASLLIPLNLFSNVLNSISLGYKPQTVSYGIAFFELSKIPLGLILVYFLEWGLLGVILTVVLSTTIKVSLLFYYVRQKLSGKIKLKVLKFWFKMSWLSGFSQIAGLIHRMDIAIFTLLFTSFTGLAFWGAAMTIGTLVLHSGKIYQALHPKILATEKKGIAIETIKRTFFFGIPFLCATIIFGKIGLYILNPLYVNVIFIVYIYAIFVFIQILKELFFEIGRGFEKVDKNFESNFRDYLHSNLFKIPSLNVLFSSSYLIILTVFLIYAKLENFAEIEILTYWGLIQLLVSIPFAVYSYFLINKKYDISIPIKEILVYIGIGFISSLITYVAMENYLVFQESVFILLPSVLPFLLLGVFLYFGLAFLVDPSIRLLYRKILLEFKHKI